MILLSLDGFSAPTDLCILASSGGTQRGRGRVRPDRQQMKSQLAGARRQQSQAGVSRQRANTRACMRLRLRSLVTYTVNTATF